MRRLLAILTLLCPALAFATAPDWQPLSSQSVRELWRLVTVAGEPMENGDRVRAYVVGADTSAAENQADGTFNSGGGFYFTTMRTGAALRSGRYDIYDIDGEPDPDSILADNAYLHGSMLPMEAADDTTVADEAIDTAALQDEAVTTAKLDDDAVDVDKLADNSVNSASIIDAAVSNADIGLAQVDSTHVGFGRLSPTDLAADGATSGLPLMWNGTKWDAQALGVAGIATDGVGTAEIATDAVGSAEVAADAIGASEIATSAVTTTEIADGTIASADLTASTLTLGSNLVVPGTTQLGDAAADSVTLHAAAVRFLRDAYVQGKLRAGNDTSDVHTFDGYLDRDDGCRTVAITSGTNGIETPWHGIDSGQFKVCSVQPISDNESNRFVASAYCYNDTLYIGLSGILSSTVTFLVCIERTQGGSDGH